MKKTKIAIVTLVDSILGAVTPAFASEGVREDGSYYLVWAFLCMCALIIVVQLLPVILMVVGAVKGASKGKQPTIEPLSDK